MTTEPQTKKVKRHSVKDDLSVLIRARYPILYVVTWEEGRVERHLREIAAKRNKELFCWSITCGLHKPTAGVKPGSNRTLADPIEALDAVIEHKEPAIYLFKDFHPFTRPRDCNAAVIRKLREVAVALRTPNKMTA